MLKMIFIFTIIASLILSAPLTLADNTADDIKVTLNGENITFDQPPVIVDGRTLVPIRAVCEALGADVYWYEPDKVTIIVKNEIKLLLSIEMKYISKMIVSNFSGFLERLEQNDDSYISSHTLDVPPQIIGDRTLLPIRAVCEELGAEVDWDEVNRTVVITCDDEIINNKNTDIEFFDSYTTYYKKYISSDIILYDEARRVRLDYPLKEVDVSDSSEYVLVCARYKAGALDYKSESVTYEAITDTAAIKANKDIFAIVNIIKMPSVFPGTYERFTLYKDGEQLAMEFYFPHHSRSVEYGTLEFEPVSVLQYDLLSGAEIVEEGENYTIAFDAKEEDYYLYAHGKDKLSPDATVFVDYIYSLERVPRPTNRYGNIIEFATHESSFTWHYFFDIDELKISERYSDIKAIDENLILYQDHYPDNVIVIHDMFDTQKDRREIMLDSKEIKLLDAEFRDDSELWVKYLLPNGKTEERIYNLYYIPLMTSEE